MATVQTSPSAAAAAIFCASSRSAPSSAAIAPTPTGTAACIACPRSFSSLAVVGEVERPGRGKRRIFAKAVAGDEMRGLGKVDAAFAGQRPEHRKRMRHNRRLGILGELQFVVGTLAHQLEEVLAESLVDFAEHVASGRAGLAERIAHADRLAALPRKKECAHRNPCCSVLKFAGELGRSAKIAKSASGEKQE